MNKLAAFFALAVMVALMPCVAQNKHLDFFGIPVDGSVEEFSQRMTERDFMLADKDNESAMFFGEVDGYPDCFVAAVAHEGIDKIVFVLLNLPDRESWEEVIADYDEMVRRMTARYGVPVKQTAEFKGMRTPVDSKDKWKRLIKKKCVWSSVFKVTEGKITVELSYSGCVSVTFEDAINSNLLLKYAFDHDI